MPTISVLMSVYNDEKYLSQSIESVLNQNCKDFEFIIINDGSTDGSQKIIAKYAERDNRIIPIQQENLGLTKSLNKGLQIARGEYIARHDSDDISHPDRLKLQYEYLQKYTQIFGCFCWTKVIDDNGSEIGEIHFSSRPERIKKTLNRGKNIYTHGSVLYKKEAIYSIGGYDTNIKSAQDYDLWLRLLNNNYSIGAVDCVLYNWRLHSNSISIAKNYDQRKYSDISLYNNFNKQNSSTKKLKNPILHHYHNLYFRSQARLKILKVTFELFRCNELSMRELLKTIVAINPINYRSIFKYF